MSSTTFEAPEARKRNGNGFRNFIPDKISPPPVSSGHGSALAFGKWLFGFPGIWPWNALYLGIGIATWTWATPPALDDEDLRTLVGRRHLLLRNLALTLAFTAPGFSGSMSSVLRALTLNTTADG